VSLGDVANRNFTVVREDETAFDVIRRKRAMLSAPDSGVQLEMPEEFNVTRHLANVAFACRSLLKGLS
jgi:hypothetical protein